MKRRTAWMALASAGMAPALWAQGALPKVVVWKGPQCGCCKDWIEHLRQQGFSDIQVHEDGNDEARQRLKMPLALGSCHTAQIGRYVIEGHVPAADIKRLLKNQTDALGLAVPGMPVGSPGMDGPAYGGRHDPYEVLLVRRDGSTRVFQTYR
ncbi:DUF411 domain-containing protein [Inhella gelatinilytica]|uniref:DUF411 domain-containing protein n=1 Tax=Inhella gelatinilytica TaxID=2795030 RepID=A0A931IUN4_9BURK|nr:DUF411 domain-containing protein [Inhella gelatinilytica]MBH9552267.1 DUF411 domain-containing protein [Inhella gelatinilytica]